MNLKPLVAHIRATLAINPDPYSPKVSESRVNSFTYALAGILHTLRYAKNVRIQALATLVVIGLGLWLGLTRLEWAVLVLVIGVNWLTEFLNSAVEAVVNLASPDYHPMAQVAKDVAAGASLLMALVSVIIAGLVLLPPLWEKVV